MPDRGRLVPARTTPFWGSLTAGLRTDQSGRSGALPVRPSEGLESVRKTGRCVVVHEAPRAAGMAADITARTNDEALYYLEAPVERVTGYDVPVPLFAREEAYLPDAEDVEEAIDRTLEG